MLRRARAGFSVVPPTLPAGVSGGTPVGPLRPFRFCKPEPGGVSLLRARHPAGDAGLYRRNSRRPGLVGAGLGRCPAPFKEEHREIHTRLLAALRFTAAEGRGEPARTIQRLAL